MPSAVGLQCCGVTVLWGYSAIIQMSPAGFEPATPALGKRCSIQLSYEDLQRLNSPIAKKKGTRFFRFVEGIELFRQAISEPIDRTACAKCKARSHEVAITSSSRILMASSDRGKRELIFVVGGSFRRGLTAGLPVCGAVLVGVATVGAADQECPCWLQRNRCR